MTYEAIDYLSISVLIIDIWRNRRGHQPGRLALLTALVMSYFGAACGGRQWNDLLPHEAANYGQWAVHFF